MPDNLRRKFIVLTTFFGLFSVALFLSFSAGTDYACQDGYKEGMRCVQPKIIDVVQCYEDDTMYTVDDTYEPTFKINFTE